MGKRGHFHREWTEGGPDWQYEWLKNSEYRHRLLAHQLLGEPFVRPGVTPESDDVAQVAEDVNTSITGIQTAITLYTLVMATLMLIEVLRWDIDAYAMTPDYLYSMTRPTRRRSRA